MRRAPSSGSTQPRARAPARFAAALALLLAPGCGRRAAPPAPPSAAAQVVRVQAEVRGLLEAQVAEWNRGDVRAFMRGYEASEALVFTSSGRVRRGYNATLARYLASYPTREAMGVLAFSDLEITTLGNDAALAFGRWRLTRASGAPAGGLFTLALRRGPGGLKIFHDHTSSDPPPAAP